MILDQSGYSAPQFSRRSLIQQTDIKCDQLIWLAATFITENEQSELNESTKSHIPD